MSFQDQNRAPARVCVGKIVAAHGVRGLVKILPYGENRDLLDGELYTAAAGEATLTVRLKNGLGKYVLAEIGGIADRTAAEAMRLTELFVARDRMPDISAQGRHYHADLVGLRVIGEDGETIGYIEGIENYGAGDLLSVKPENGPAFLLPLCEDNVPKIDINAGTITAHNTKEFRDL